MKHESGRSMVEILGVLAIVGILSVTGVIAYQYAVQQNTANQIVKDVTFGALSLAEQKELPENEEVELDFKTTSGLNTVGIRSGGLNLIKVYDVQKGVCEKLIPFKNTPEITEIYTDKRDDILPKYFRLRVLTACQDTQTLTFLSTIPTMVNGCWGLLLACQKWCAKQGGENCQPNSCINESCIGPFSTTSDNFHGRDLNGRCLDFRTWDWRDGQYYYDGYIRYYNPKNQKWDYFKGTGRNPWCG